jgi:peptide/nickel transport system permease protein
MLENDRTNAVLNNDDIEEAKMESQFLEVLRRLKKNKLATAGLILLLIITVIAICAPILTKYNYSAINLANKFKAPSWEHWCGTDEFGRDIFTRLVYGTRWSLGLGLATCAFALFIGIILGCVAGFFGGKIEELIMRACDVFQSIPGLLLSIIISAALGTGFFNTVLALGISRIPFFARMLRATFMSQRKQEYVEAAQAQNLPKFKLMFKQILPNAVSPLIVASTMGIGNTVAMAAGLSYIGLGVQPPTPEWGAMLSAARAFIRYYPYMILFPGLCIALLVLALNLLGDGLRDAMDPKLRD